jgi:hypothetical protein
VPDTDPFDALVLEREAFIQDMLGIDGVPPDSISACALISLGIRAYYGLGIEREVIALVLERWADRVRHDAFGPPAIEEK